MDSRVTPRHSPTLVAAPAQGPMLAVARQPILDRHQRVFGYELQFGSASGPASFTEGFPAVAARTITDAMLHVGLDVVTGGGRAFIKVGRQALLHGFQTALPPSRVVVELTADVEGDDEVLRACRDLRDAGYAIAIDDFELVPSTAPLVPIANYLKIDFRTPVEPGARARMIACLRPGVTAVIATHVETFDQFETAVRDGFTYAQGFFLGRPMLLPARDIPGQHLATLKLLRALNDPNLPLSALEELVSHDAALCYRILRTVNSWAFALRRSVQSMHDALLLVGRDAVRRWASIYAVAGLGERAPSELVVMSTVRARLAELLAASVRDQGAGDAFLLGMCSLLDVLLGRSMQSIVEELPLDVDTKRALCGEANAKRRLLDCVIAYEHGDWATCSMLAQSLRIDPAVLPGAAADALRWSQELRDPAFQRAND
jgi:EAL and modified HD-GYP domain-containing signal transduction protein